MVVERRFLCEHDGRPPGAGGGVDNCSDGSVKV